MIALKAHFDGKVLVPDEPLALSPNQQVRLTIEPIPSPSADQPRRKLGTQPGVLLHMPPDFNEHLGDEFWGLDDKKALP